MLRTLLRHAGSKRFLLCIAVLVFPLFAWGQATNSSVLTGTVVDPTGSVVPGATATLTRPSTGFRATVKTNGAGQYTFLNLQSGNYSLQVSAHGFATAKFERLVIPAGRTINQGIRMKVGATSSTVTVQGNQEVLETTSNTLNTTIQPDEVKDLPLNGRDALPFAQLVAGAQSPGDSRFTTFNGLPNASLNITVDGMNDNFQRFKTSSAGFFNAAPLRLGAVKEVTVSTNDLTADAGAQGAVALRFELKRGTNQFHGGVFWQTQNSAFDANTYENNSLGIKKPPYHLNDFGGDVGGPIIKNKLFFFFNYEQEFVPGSRLGTQYVLSPSAQQGNFSYTGTDNAEHTVNLFKIAAQNGFPDTVNSLIAKQFQQINTYNGKATLKQTVLPYQNLAVWRYSTTTKNIYPTLRLDYQITPKIEWHAAYDLYWRDIPGYEQYAGDPNVNSGFRSTYSTLTSGLNWIISSSLVNQLNFGLLNTQEEFNPGNSFNPFTSENNVIINSPGFVNGGTTLSPVIPNYFLPEPRNNPVRQVFDNLTWTHGAHTFTLGGSFRDATAFDTGVSDPPGYYLGINPLDPALSMFNSANFPAMNFSQTNQQDLLNAENLYATLVGRVNNIYGTNYVSSATHQYETLGVFREAEAQNVGGIYAQDAWRVSQRFALNYGFRWQFSGAIHNTNNTYVNPTVPNLLGPSGKLFQPGVLDGVANPQIDLNPSPYSADLVQPAPNFGFAWNPKFDQSRNVIRGGTSISYYDPGWETFESAALYSNPGVTQVVYANAGSPTNTPTGEFPAGSVSLGGAAPALTSSPSSFTFPQPESGFTFGYQPFGAINPKIHSPYVENWYFGIQHKFPHNMVFQADYVGNHSVHEWILTDLNEVNIFENGFLQDFQNAQQNLAASGGSTFAGSSPMPILNQAFGAGSSNFTNPTYLSYVQTGQAGALANAIASNSNFFCNLVGNGGGSFSPCGDLGYTSGTAYPINIFQANPYATGEPIELLTDAGSESYNGLQVQLKHPVGKNLIFMANYTYSHSFTNRYIGDYYTADSALMNFTTLRDPHLNRVPSPYDLRNAFRIWGLYHIPFHSPHRALREVAGGWTLSTIFTWQSGRNFKLLGGTNTYNYFDNANNIPDASDSGVELHGISRKQLQSEVGRYRGPNNVTPVLLMNPKVFSSGEVTPEETPGKLGQFIFLTGPQYINDDLAATKVFTLYRKLSLNIQAEMLNVFNHPAWAVVDGYSGGTNNPAQYINLQSNPVVPGTQSNPEGLQSGGSRDIQFRAALQF